MKKLIILLLLLPLFSTAQDWQTVPLNQHSVFRVEASGVDSFWNGYIRCIYVEDSSATALGTNYNFYASVRLDKNETLDTQDGATWLGHNYVRNNNGNEYYFNKYEDTIILKTNSQLSDSWIITKDTMSNLIFEATITQMDTLTINGILDSTKTISIQAFQNNVSVNSVYNSLKIILSKNHGLVQAFDFYGFPNYELCSDYMALPFSDDVFPILPKKHSLLSDSFCNINYMQQDLNWQYSAGNEWQTIVRKSPAFWIRHDTIISSQLFHPDSISVTRRIRSKSFIPVPVPTYNTGDTIITDTVFNKNIIKRIITDSAEHINTIKNILHAQNFGSSYNYFNWQFVDTFCNGRILKRDTTNSKTVLSGYRYYSHYNYQGFDVEQRSAYEWDGSIITIDYRMSPIYFNLNGCQVSTFTPYLTIATNDLHKLEKEISLYPNPTGNTFSIKTEVDWNKLEIINTLGKKVAHFENNQNNFDISGLNNGIYFVRIKTDKGIISKKILKE